MDCLVIPFLIYLFSSLFDFGLTVHFIQGPWQEGNPWARLLVLHFGKWSLIPAVLIEAVAIGILTHQLSKRGSKVLAFCSLAAPTVIHVLAGLMWLPWTGLAEKVTILQLQLLGVIVMVFGLIIDLAVTRKKEIKQYKNKRLPSPE